MPKPGFPQDASCNLPPGFRFEPTDEEIVFQYLACKTLSRPLPASIVPEIDVFAADPWELPGELERDRYFFSNMASNMGRTKKTTCTGFWKPIGFQKLIVSPSRMPIVGIKKTLVFYRGKGLRASRTDWIVHVYFIALAHNKAPRSNHHFQGSLVRLGKWVLCHVLSRNGGSHVQKNSVGQETSDAESSFSDTESSTLDESVSSTSS